MKKSVICVTLIMLVLFAGCGRNEQKETTSTISPVVENTTIVESTTATKNEITSETTTQKIEVSDTTTTRPYYQKSAGQTTTRKVNTTQKQTTTPRQTTTQKVTTTQKPATTKKVTTTSAPYWCDEGGTHHIVDVGQIGWCNSYEEAQSKALKYIDNNADSGNFRVIQCYGCGKYSAEVTLD